MQLAQIRVKDLDLVSVRNVDASSIAIDGDIVPAALPWYCKLLGESVSGSQFHWRGRWLVVAKEGLRRRGSQHGEAVTQREVVAVSLASRSRIPFRFCLARFAVQDKSLMLLTQGLGRQPFHGRVVMLVND
jgi:hypothetical protein